MEKAPRRSLSSLGERVDLLEADIQKRYEKANQKAIRKEAADRKKLEKVLLSMDDEEVICTIIEKAVYAQFVVQDDTSVTAKCLLFKMQRLKLLVTQTVTMKNADKVLHDSVESIISTFRQRNPTFSIRYKQDIYSRERDCLFITKIQSHV